VVLEDLQPALGVLAESLEAKAAALRARFNRDFWLDDAGFYALALQKGHGAAAVRSSNPGQAFWTGIADPDKARRTIEAFLTPEMFSGWGVRTLSTAERRYNPVGYHLGTVWPHDNAFIAAGCRHYGCDAVAEQIFGGLVAAAGHFAHHRLPEVFAGFSRDVFAVPVRYPIACHPQAWAASAIPFLLETVLGLVPEAFEGRLRIERPILPAFLNRVCLRRLRVGDARVDLRFERGRHGIAVEVLDVSGDLQIVLDQATTG
jgi:glycogen debranching enzyme